MKYLLILLFAAIVIYLIMKPTHFFEHRGGGGRGGRGGGGRGGGRGGGGWGRGGRGGGGWGRGGWGRNRWGGGWGSGWGWNDVGSGWGWLYDPVYYVNTVDVNALDEGNSCQNASLSLYKACVDRGTRKEDCASGLVNNLKHC